MRRIAFMATLAFGAAVLSSCGTSKRPDRSFDLCFHSSDGASAATAMLRGVSDRFSYRFREYGAKAKADLKTIDASPSVIPEGRPVQLDIARNDGKILLIASNFGEGGNDLRVSFFYQSGEGEGSPFFETVVSGMRTLPDADLHPNDAETSTGVCGDRT